VSFVERNYIVLTSVEGYNNQLGTLGSELMEDVLVIVDGVPTVSGCGHNTGATSGQKTLENLHTDTALTNSGK
jgi:hypothetical protein